MAQLLGMFAISSNDLSAVSRPDWWEHQLRWMDVLQHIYAMPIYIYKINLI